MISHRVALVVPSCRIVPSLDDDATIIKVMQAAVATEQEWASAATDLDRFVSCAPNLFESFSRTGKIPDHPLLSGNHEIGDDRDGNNCGYSIGGADGERSPGAFNSNLVPGSRRRAASVPVGDAAAASRPCRWSKGKDYSGSTSNKSELSKGAGRNGGGTARASASRSNGSLISLRSPPRARARTAWPAGPGRRSSNNGNNRPLQNKPPVPKQRPSLTA